LQQRRAHHKNTQPHSKKKNKENLQSKRKILFKENRSISVVITACCGKINNLAGVIFLFVSLTKSEEAEKR